MFTTKGQVERHLQWLQKSKIPYVMADEDHCSSCIWMLDDCSYSFDGNPCTHWCTDRSKKTELS